ncbi:hypothetical protein ACOTTU_24150 [Roseobacter sp. EG26]|uniref:hypothetical protein n=1 Tax=Roseobacter sp. EG26 TaxID=3412477 RepID=UPI003CE5325C
MASTILFLSGCKTSEPDYFFDPYRYATFDHFLDAAFQAVNDAEIRAATGAEGLKGSGQRLDFTMVSHNFRTPHPDVVEIRNVLITSMNGDWNVSGVSSEGIDGVILNRTEESENSRQFVAPPMYIPYSKNERVVFSFSLVLTTDGEEKVIEIKRRLSTWYTDSDFYNMGRWLIEVTGLWRP